MNDAYFEQPGAAICVLVEFDYNDGGVIKTARFSSADYWSHGTDNPAYIPYDPFVIGGLEFERKLSEAFTGRSTITRSDVELLAHASINWLKTVRTAGLNISVWVGNKSWPKSQFKRLYSGICKAIKPGSNAFQIPFEDSSAKLRKSILARFTSGQAEGENIPLCLGRCFNVTPVLIDATAHTYQFNAVASAAVSVVRFNGDAVSTDDYDLDLSVSTITFTTQPIGTVTIDVDGAVIGGTWLQTASDFINYILTTIVGEQPTVAALPNYLLGCFIATDKDIDIVIDLICATVGGYWLYDRLNTFQCRFFNGVTGVTTGQLDKAQTKAGSRNVLRIIPPLNSINLGYGKNYTPLSNVAGNAFTADPQLADRLQKQELTVTRSNNNLAEFQDAESITVSTLIVNQSDAVTEAERRLNIANLPRYIESADVFTGPFNWLLGDEIALEVAGVNGNCSVSTRLLAKPLTGESSVELWQ